MRGLYYTLNVLYVTIVPALAIIIQGGLNHEFVFEQAPKGLSNYLMVFSTFYVIAMLLILSFLVYQENNERVLLALLISGPLSGFLIAWFAGGRPVEAIYHMYLIEGGSLISVLIFQTTRHFKRIKRESGAFAYVVLSFFLLSFLGGFLRSIDFKFLHSIYTNWWSYFGLFVALLISFSSIFYTLDRIDEAHGRTQFGGKMNANYYAFPEAEINTFQGGTPLVVLSAILGFLAYGFHEKLMDWECLMLYLQ